MLQTRKHQKVLAEEFTKGSLTVINQRRKTYEERLCSFIPDLIMPADKSLDNIQAFIKHYIVSCSSTFFRAKEILFI